MVLGQLGSTHERTKLDPYLTPHTKSSSKGIKDPNVRAKTIKLLEENVRVNLHDLGFGQGFLDMTLKAQETKGKRDRLDFDKIKAFVLQRTPLRKTPTGQKNVFFKSHIQLGIRLYKEF